EEVEEEEAEEEQEKQEDSEDGIDGDAELGELAEAVEISAVSDQDVGNIRKGPSTKNLSDLQHAPENITVLNPADTTESNAVAEAKKRLLASLAASRDARSMSDMVTSTIQPNLLVDSESRRLPTAASFPLSPEAKAMPAGQGGDAIPSATRSMATLDMIITIVGEVYGQRDLLSRRTVWDR
ncbi:MAG: hypothetical protein Q9181_004808, partial [Wetmoreana brouardii]